jgi:hypothetical protein
MESFFLSETLKYLFLLFDEGIPLLFFTNQDNPLHSLDSNFVFTTEGHPLHLSNGYKRSSTSDTVAATCQVPPTSTSFNSAILSIPDAFHPFTPNTTLKSNFIPLLDTKGVSSLRTILEAQPF